MARTIADSIKTTPAHNNAWLNPRIVLQTIYDSAHKWFGESNPKVIEDRVRSILNSRVQEFVLAALGLNISFSRIEFNNDSAGSKLKALIDSVAADTAANWFKESLPKLKLTGADLQSFQDSMRKRYRETMNARLAKLVEEQADADAVRVLAGIGYNPGDLPKMLELVTPTKDGAADAEKRDFVFAPHDWKTRGVVDKAEFIMLVRVLENGSLTQEGIDRPGVKVMALISLHALLNNAFAVIVSDGNSWLPVDLVSMDSSAYNSNSHISTKKVTSWTKSVNISKAKVAQQFTHEIELIFNYMNEIDRGLISGIFAQHLTEQG